MRRGAGRRFVPGRRGAGFPGRAARGRGARQRHRDPARRVRTRRPFGGGASRTGGPLVAPRRGLRPRARPPDRLSPASPGIRDPAARHRRRGGSTPRSAGSARVSRPRRPFQAQLVEWGTSLEELQAERRRDLRIAKLIDSDVSPRNRCRRRGGARLLRPAPGPVRGNRGRAGQPHPDRDRLRRRPPPSATRPGRVRKRSAARQPSPGPTSPPSRESIPTTARRRQRAASSASSPGDRPCPRSRRPCSCSQPGAIGPVTESRFGFHVIRADARRDARVVPFEEAGGGIRRMLVEQARQALTAELIARLRAAGEIETYL